MNLLSKIEDLANKGLAINYEIVDQDENGTREYNPTIQLKTYTVGISEISTVEHDQIECGSFDSLEEGIKYFIKYAEECLKDWDEHVTGCESEDYDCLCKGCDYRDLRYHCCMFRQRNKFWIVKPAELKR